MTWIVLGENKGRIQLVSKGEVTGLLPKGAYLTIQEGETKFILRIDNSVQHEAYAPTPMIIDMNLAPLKQDQKCQNIISAYRVKDVTNRTDGLIDYIKPLSIARRSTQAEIDEAMGSNQDGPPVFPATVYYGKGQLLKDDEEHFITTKLPVDMFYHQMLVCGKTGAGKTVATKYLAQYFVEKLEGAVLAINVKEADFLKMDKPSKTNNSEVLKEWEELKETAHGIASLIIYYPANTTMKVTRGVTVDKCVKITLDVKKIEPESLIGLLQGISDVATQNLPNIFRYWQERIAIKDKDKFTFNEFVDYFNEGPEKELMFSTLNKRGDESQIKLHRGTFDNIQRNLDVARGFFDNKDAKFIDESDILLPGKMSVIDVTTDVTAIQFGSILLRDLLHRIVTAKNEERFKVPLLLIIDEVHKFYDSKATIETLGELDTICRTGRSQKIGVIFSSQDPSDIPGGLSSVINTKIFFRSDISAVKSQGLIVTPEEMETLKKGYAAASIYDLAQLKFLKFPMAYAGVTD